MTNLQGDLYLLKSPPSGFEICRRPIAFRTCVGRDVTAWFWDITMAGNVPS